MKDATLTQVINQRVTTAQRQSAAKESPRAAISTPSDDIIRELAYRKWQVDGCPEDDGIDNWLQAERELAMVHSYEPLDGVGDQDLEKRVLLCLFGRGYAALHLVTVNVTNGVVVLRGKMPSFYMRQLAIECTKQVAGVRRMVDNLHVDTCAGRVGESLNLASLNDSNDQPLR